MTHQFCRELRFACYHARLIKNRNPHSNLALAKKQYMRAGYDLWAIWFRLTPAEKQWLWEMYSRLAEYDAFKRDVDYFLQSWYEMIDVE